MGARQGRGVEGGVEEAWGSCYCPSLPGNYLEAEERAVARRVEAVRKLRCVCAQRPVYQGCAALCSRPATTQ